MTTQTRPNIILITADDMNWDAVGAYDCPTPDTTPNIDRLAAEGIRFNHAHVTIAVCQPSRSVMMTGLYPHHSGGEGFYHLRYDGVPVLPRLLQNEGYSVGILGKLVHSSPYADIEWEIIKDNEELGMGRSPEAYHKYAKEFMQQAQDSDKPFFLMFNSRDPHRPFYGNDRAEWYDDNREVKAGIPSKVFDPEEVTIPGFLEELPEVRQEIAEYYSSVRRCDDTVGRLMDELDEQGIADNTMVIFLSDNGMAFPFAKTNCYLNSTKTPWVVRWPETIKAGRVDNDHFISGIDMLPTILDAAGVDIPKSVDGTSFLPVLKGEQQEERASVFTQFHQTAAKRNYPMRGVQTSQYGYIFNPWSDGERTFINESQAGRTFKAMKAAIENDASIKERVDLFLYRVPEELYDFQNDPDARNNLINDPDYADVLEDMRKQMREYMVATNDPALECFDNQDNNEKFIAQMNQELGFRQE